MPCKQKELQMPISRIENVRTNSVPPVNFDIGAILFDNVSSVYPGEKVAIFNDKKSVFPKEARVVSQNDLLTKALPRLGAKIDGQGRIFAGDLNTLIDGLRFYTPNLALQGGVSEPVNNDAKLYVFAKDLAADIFNAKADVFDAKTGKAVGLSNYAYAKLTGTLDMPGYRPDDPDAKKLVAEPACCH
jgi:hypothetical protein